MVASLLLLLTHLACSDSAQQEPEPVGRRSDRCLVRLHGKGGNGTKPEQVGAITVLNPGGNDSGWGGRQWLYYPDSQYQEALSVIQDEVTSCEKVVLHGFSNGGAFVAKIYCRGEDLGGRLVGVVIDDPVTDAAVDDCEPRPSVRAVLYWTGALEGVAAPDWRCREHDWTCEGGRTQGIQRYSANLDVSVTRSPFREHAWYIDAPETTEWFEQID
jgi:hypothetical protein